MNLHEEITKLQAKIKTEFKKAAEATSLCRLDSMCYRPNGKRSNTIEQLTEDYYAKTGKLPDGIALERLSDLCLYEELTDTHPDKVTRTEYPFFSEHQFEERHKSEASFKLAEEQGVDGRNHKPPVRRMRSNKDNKFVDNNARIRNKERQRRYSEFTKVQPVISYKINTL